MPPPAASITSFFAPDFGLAAYIENQIARARQALRAELADQAKIAQQRHEEASAAATASVADLRRQTVADAATFKKALEDTHAAASADLAELRRQTVAAQAIDAATFKQALGA